MAEEHRLHALADSAYAPIRDRVPKVLDEERYHREHAEHWLDRLTDAPEGRRRVQDAFDRLLSLAETMFAPTAEESVIVDRGLRPTALPDLRAAWHADVEEFVESLGLTLPDSSMPTATGRNGDHGEDWHRLHSEMTETYRDLGRTSAVRIRDETGDV